MEKLAKTVKDFGYQNITCKNMKVSDGWVVECKVDDLFSSLSHGNDLMTAMDNAANIIENEILKFHDKKYRVKINNFCHNDYVLYFTELYLNNLPCKIYAAPELFVLVYLNTSGEVNQFIKMFNNMLLGTNNLEVKLLEKFDISDVTSKTSLDEQSLYPKNFHYSCNIDNINLSSNVNLDGLDVKVYYAKTPITNEDNINKTVEENITPTNTNIYSKVNSDNVDVKVYHVKPSLSNEDNIKINIDNSDSKNLHSENIKSEPKSVGGKQKYDKIPLSSSEVNGSSSKTIFKFMTYGNYSKDSDHPWDVDDWERNRALLLCYPEWRKRLLEMSKISLTWAKLVHNWAKIEKLYDEDYEKYGNKAYNVGKCCLYIRELIK